MFGGHTLDLTRGSLRSGDRTIELRPKSFGVLVYLVQNAGRLVSKDELIQAVWPDVAVSDDSLAKCVSEVRAALRDGDQRLVKTVPRRGYVLDVPVSPVDGASGLRVPVSAAVVDLPAAAGVATADARPVARPAPPWWRAHARLAALVLTASTAAVVLSLGWGHLIAPPAPDRASIAVLPFSKGHTPEYDYFTDGLTEDLITSLGRFRELLVIARDSTFVYKGRQVAPQEIGRELGVRYLLEGAVRREGDSVRITTRLIDATTGGQIWGESYERALANISAVQDDVTQNIVRSLVAHVDRSELARVSRKPTVSLAAYDLCLRGKALLTMRHGDTRGAMVLQDDVTLRGRAVAGAPEFAGGDAVLPVGRAELVAQDLGAVEPVLDMLALDHDAADVPLANGPGEVGARWIDGVDAGRRRDGLPAVGMARVVEDLVLGTAEDVGVRSGRHAIEDAGIAARRNLPLEIERKVILRMLNEYPQVALNMRTALSERLAATMGELQRVRQTLATVGRRGGPRA